MNYKIKESEWRLLMYFYQKYIQQFSPIVRTSIISVFSTLESEKTITQIDQANVVIILLTASIEKEAEITDIAPDQKTRKSRQPKHVNNKDILILLDSLRLFLEYNNVVTSDKYKQIQEHENF